MIKHINDTYPESQYGFCSGHGTIDMNFSLQQVMEKEWEKNKVLFMVFINLTKTFGTVNQ